MGKVNNFLVWVWAVLLSVGGIAWGFYGASRLMGNEFLLVDWIVRFPIVANILYLLVGLAGVLLIPSVVVMILSFRRRR